MRALVCAITLILLQMSPASATVLTFDGPCLAPSILACSLYEEDGFRVLPILGGHPVFDLANALFAHNDLNFGAQITRVDGQPFDLLQADSGGLFTTQSVFQSSKGDVLIANHGTTLFTGDAWRGITSFRWSFVFGDFDDTSVIRSVALDNVVVVPEPSLLVLIGAGVLATAGRARR